MVREREVFSLIVKNKTEKNKNRLVIILIILLLSLLIGLAAVLRTHRTDNSSLITDDNAVPWNGEQSLPRAAQSHNDAIAIPGFDSLVLIANQTEQDVNFYNPKINDCLFVMTLYSDNEQLWQSGYIAPGNGYYQIELEKVLYAGKHNGRLRVQCFKSDGTELNSANINFELEIIERK